MNCRTPSRHALFALVTWISLSAVTACEPSTSSSTHWLTCQTKTDCGAPNAVACSNGYCVDSNGDKIDASKIPASGGTAGTSGLERGGATTQNSGGTTARGGNDAGSSAGNTGVGGTIGTSGGGASSGAGGPSSGGTNSGICASHPSNCFPLCEGGLCECYCPTVGGAGNAGTAGNGAMSGGGSAGSAASSNRSGSAGAAGACSTFDAAFVESIKGCSIDTDCMKVRYQVDCCGANAWVGIRADRAAAMTACLATRPAFPACGCASMGDQAEDGRYTSFAGDEVGVSCVANRCLTHVTTRTCGVTTTTTCTANQVCVSYESTVGPTSTVEYACVTNPCSAKLDCTCGQAACNLRSDTSRTCRLPSGPGVTNIVDIGCQDNRQ
jgi:hypothetical protein